MNFPLEIKTFPLKGSCLIEASAGTGKTYTIALLYVRLVLQHGGTHAFIRELVPPEILVVTFTEAASQELSDRIRARLAEAARAFADAAFRQAVDAPLQALIADYSADQYAACAMKLQRAAEWMDEAAVSTIHSWCYRMLREHAFDSRNLFTQELATNQDALLLEVVEDYWRQHFYSLEEQTADLVCRHFGSPEVLFDKVKPLTDVTRGTPVFAGDQIDFSEGLQKLQSWIRARYALIAKIKNSWMEDIAGVEFILLDRKDDLNKKRHGNMEVVLPIVSQWVQSDSFVLPKYVDTWCENDFQLVAKAKNKAQPSHKVFQLIGELSEYPESEKNLLLAALQCHAADWIRHEFDRRTQHRAELGVGDMLLRLQAALQGESGERLAQAIRAQFPVA
ncbi:MAG: UvrD-helicase domain-containing protein, partial [Pseudomonadales bacterium]|nr:UvrD-helicase domain-containing protein [Pseudomonadales bacterium]